MTENCYTCEGSGEATCFDCGGEPYGYDVIGDDNDGNEMAYRYECGTCRGSGTLACGACEGTGERRDDADDL